MVSEAVQSMKGNAGSSEICRTAVIVEDPEGLHLRPAAALVKVANQFESDVSVEYDGQQADGKSLLSVCMLAARRGAELTVSAVGHDAMLAVRAIEGALARLFGVGGTATTRRRMAASDRRRARRARVTPRPTRSRGETGEPDGTGIARAVRAESNVGPSRRAGTLSGEEERMRRRGKTGVRQMFVWTIQASEKEVLLAGEFSDWRPLPMARREDCFETSVHLAPGVYQYKFIVDGVWRADPSAADAAPNPFGTANSVIRVS